MFDNSTSASNDIVTSNRIDFTAPWQIAYTYRFTPGGDSAGTAFKVFLGFPANACVLALNYESGDGASNQISQIEISDAGAQDVVAGPLASTTAADHTVIWTFDGTDIVCNYDGVDVLTLPAAILGTPGNQFMLIKFGGPLLSQITVREVSMQNL